MSFLSRASNQSVRILQTLPTRIACSLPSEMRLRTVLAVTPRRSATSAGEI